MSFDLLRWFAEVASQDWIWYAKYLAANDTLATGGHQVGLYIPKVVFGTLFPTAVSSHTPNPSHTFPAVVASEGRERVVRAIWYNKRVLGQGTRDECRITRWGGQSSDILDPEATGSLCIFAFRLGSTRDAEECRVWLCRDLVEEDIAQDWLGFVDPGSGALVSPSGQQLPDVAISEADSPCVLSPERMPAEWLKSFPDPTELAARAVSNLPTARRKPPDDRLLLRRDCEYQLFRSVEEVHVFPRVQEGFCGVDEFVGYANAVTNRRKSRSGSSLELQVKTILEEEKLPFSHDAVSEANKRPDFLFPSADRYRDEGCPPSKLRMLGVKTTCKDRWRQILEEADRVPYKHLLTLQRGVSSTQFKQMNSSGIRLVVPSALHTSYPKEVQGSLLTFADFIAEARAACE
ncbi:MAG: type II restriction endonuclease [Gemmatimonadetes bacterium]|nr:type II restriction endonuclease [Gemmatimonadota bacterium]MBK7784539.1 type II restriction endonuclease [Gemmatimonadota bacterium]MBK9067416.1 type II restriction endonuclease [Gemmatimonadota bacterium]